MTKPQTNSKTTLRAILFVLFDFFDSSWLVVSLIIVRSFSSGAVHFTGIERRWRYWRNDVFLLRGVMWTIDSSCFRFAQPLPELPPFQRLFWRWMPFELLLARRSGPMGGSSLARSFLSLRLDNQRTGPAFPRICWIFFEQDQQHVGTGGSAWWERPSDEWALGYNTIRVRGVEPV